MIGRKQNARITTCTEDRDGTWSCNKIRFYIWHGYRSELYDDNRCDRSLLEQKINYTSGFVEGRRYQVDRDKFT